MDTERSQTTMLSTRRSLTMRRELSAVPHVPYEAHVASTVIKTVYGDYLQAFRLSGASFETSDDIQLNGCHERLNVLWRNIAGPNVALWTQVVRRHDDLRDVLAQWAEGGREDTSFAEDLAAKYVRRLQSENLMVNEVYLAVVYRPATRRATGALSRILAMGRRDETTMALADALESCEKIAQTLTASLERYEPERLGVYEVNGTSCSTLLEYLAMLANGERRRVALPRQRIADVLVANRVLFGHETIEYRTPTATRVGAILGIKEYPTPTVVGMYDRLLSAPFPFVLTQSFAFLSKAAGQSLLQRQYNRMINAGDFAVSQAQELTAALDQLTSNEFVMGDHHFSLQILADVEAGGDSAAPGMRLKRLHDQVAMARSLLADTGMIVAREDLGLEAAFWAQLPGNFAMRPRKAPITSRNFAAMAPFHNFPAGRARGNHWGHAVLTLMTAANSPYHFSLHASDPADPDGGSRKDIGHTLICGPSGSGKTVLIGFLVATLSRRQTTQIVFDKDRGLEILVRALGGEYLALKNGNPTGFNPLQLPRTAANLEFLKIWLRSLCWQPGGIGNPRAAGIREEADLDQALRGTLALDIGSRRLSRLIEFLDSTQTDGPYQRLSRWCASTRGDYSWAFDNTSDLVVSRMQGRSIVGFDVTEFIDNPLTRAPVTLYLFHLVRQLLDGRRLVCWMDEFWRMLADPAFESFAKDGPKTWRKLNAVMCLATQNAGDVLDSPISRTLIEQTPTKIFFPNADASPAEYTQGFGLTEREFALIRDQLAPGSRSFLVKQSHQSVICKLDLKNFDAELSVISGRAVAVRRMHDIIARTGDCVEKWLPAFMSGT